MKRIDFALLPTGSRVLCAVSGGADSMCLLGLLNARRTELGLELYAAHFEHGIRGEESLRDESFVKEQCRRLGVPCLCGRGDVPGFARERGLGVEEAARILRYDFLEETAEKLGCDRIALAHNADDNAETILLNLVRGAGIRGLAGIPPRRGRIVRPLLDWTREEILACLEELDLPYVEDGSNQSDEYRRNRIRHQVMPLLREMNPRFSQAAGRTSALLRQDEDCLNAQAEDFIGNHFDGRSLPLGAFSGLHPAVASRVLRRLCPRSLEWEQVRAVLALGEGTERACLDLPGIRVTRERGRMYFGGEEARELPDRELKPGERLEIPERGLLLDSGFARQSEIHDLFKTYCFKSESICGKILVTGWRPGDRIRPLGRGCTKTLKALFLEAGLDTPERMRRIVLRDEAGLLAVEDLARDERTRAEPDGEVLWIRFREKE